jgi:poly(3-hydroxyalkanoate) synthetase
MIFNDFLDPITRRLSREKSGGRVETGASIEIMLRISKSEVVDMSKSALNPAEESLVKTNEDLEKMQSPKGIVSVAGKTASEVGRVVEDATAVADLWAPLFEKVGFFMKIVDEVAEVRTLKFPNFMNYFLTHP